ncbi:MAG: hypothetical protein QOJ03_763 [Frankiaceae bacterium]|jgi:hypothetical protein|nr:hypothetical protein [Frankiaceae bacterium]
MKTSRLTRPGIGRGRAFALLAAVAGLTAVPLTAGATPLREPADTGGSTTWAAVAAADGARVGVMVKDFLVVSNIVDAGGPAAQSVLNGFGDCKAYAAYPYPGEIALTAHGLSQGAVPNYPLIAQSNPTQPKSDVAAGPMHLRAESADDRSAAFAQSTAGGGGFAAGTTRSNATTAHDPETGAVTAEAESTLEAVSIEGVLSIGRVHSHARLVSKPGAPVQRITDTELADVMVGGQEVGVTDKGLVLAGTDVPLPPDSTANALLAAAGITVRYLAATKTPTSLVAAGLSVSAVEDVPGVGQTTVSYVFGQAAVTAQAKGAGPAATALPPVGPTGSSTPTASSGATGAPAPTGSAVVPVSGSGSAPVASPVTAGAPGAPAATGYDLASAKGPSSESLYVVIAAGAIVLVAAVQLFRILAVKLAWT